MPDIKTIFRSCPNCGKRFEIRITDKKLVNEKVASDTFSNIPVYGNPLIRPGREGTILPVPGKMNEGINYFDVKDFQYSYECKSCGHKWIEIHEKYDDSTSWKQPPKL